MVTTCIIGQYDILTLYNVINCTLVDWVKWSTSVSSSSYQNSPYLAVKLQWHIHMCSWCSHTYVYQALHSSILVKIYLGAFTEREIRSSQTSEDLWCWPVLGLTSTKNRAIYFKSEHWNICLDTTYVHTKIIHVHILIWCCKKYFIHIGFSRV